MEEMIIVKNSLVLYKNRPALVTQTGDKLELELVLLISVEAYDLKSHS